MSMILTMDTTIEAAKKADRVSESKATNTSGVTEGRQNLPADGQTMPGSAAPAKQKELSSVVEEINKHIQNTQRDLQFSVDEDAGRVVVKVLDSGTGDLIRQIPSEEMLRISQSIGESIGVIFEARA